MKNNIWKRIENQFYLRPETENEQQFLEPGIYNLEWDRDLACFKLVYIKKRFDFPFKIYGLQEKFIEKVLKTYSSIDKNLGILLNGVRGTGKTVTAEVIANSLGLPVILISKSFNSIPEFISTISQDLVLFFDEYDKVFGGNSSSFDDDDERANSDASPTLLSLMDGTLSGQNKHLFLLTTNRKFVNENMLNRPSRLRYIKEFNNLPKETVLEIIDDYLIHKEFKEDILKYVSYLELMTIDVLKSIIEEVNIHKEFTSEFSSYFNTTENEGYYEVVFLDDLTNKEEQFGNSVYIETAENFLNDKHKTIHLDRYMFIKTEQLEPLVCKVKVNFDGDKRTGKLIFSYFRKTNF